MSEEKILSIRQDQYMRASPGAKTAVHWLVECANRLLEVNAQTADSTLNPIAVFSKLPAEERIRVRIDEKLCQITRTLQTKPAPTDAVFMDLVNDLALLKASTTNRPLGK